MLKCLYQIICYPFADRNTRLTNIKMNLEIFGNHDIKRIPFDRFTEKHYLL
jgi:hypothetical protein